MRVFCRGFNLYGQLGLPELLVEEFTPVFADTTLKDIFINHSFSVLQTDNDFILYYQNEKKLLGNCGQISKISCNDERIIILNDLGKSFKLELENFDLTHEIPNMLPSEESEEKIVNIVCGSKFSVACSSKGKLFCIPNKLNFDGKDITDIKCGREHCVVLDKLGNVFTFGRGSRGQLGHGHLGDESEPVQVEALGGIEIVLIAAGGWHSCAISKEGDLYTWGWNGNGQLGLGAIEGGSESISVMASPHVVDIEVSQRNCTKVACGSKHTTVLLDNNQLYGCGWNKYKQLLCDEKEKITKFTHLYDCSNEDVLELKCGPWNSIMICK